MGTWSLFRRWFQKAGVRGSDMEGEKLIKAVSLGWWSLWAAGLSPTWDPLRHHAEHATELSSEAGIFTRQTPFSLLERCPWRYELPHMPCPSSTCHTLCGLPWHWRKPWGRKVKTCSGGKSRCSWCALQMQEHQKRVEAHKKVSYSEKIRFPRVGWSMNQDLFVFNSIILFFFRLKQTFISFLNRKKISIFSSVLIINIFDTSMFLFYLNCFHTVDFFLSGIR